MGKAIPVKTATMDLEILLQSLHLGETLTLLDTEGSPVAVVVSVRPEPHDPATATDWLARWDDLAQRVSYAWQGDKGAVETLAEMRR